MSPSTICSVSHPTASVGRSSPPNLISQKKFAYCDASNIWIGGTQVLAVHRGLAPSAKAAAQSGSGDLSYRMHAANLREFLFGKDATNDARAVCVGSTKADSAGVVWDAWRRAGWDTHISLRSASGREKAVDTELTLLMFEEVVFSGAPVDEVEVTLLSGDRDFLPVVRKLQDRGYAVDVVSWEHTTAPALKSAATRFVALDRYFDLLMYEAENG